jgi:hypothetical protein
MTVPTVLADGERSAEIEQDETTRPVDGRKLTPRIYTGKRIDTINLRLQV